MTEKNGHAQCIFVRNRQVVANLQGRNEGGKGGHNSSGAESLRGAPKNPDNVTSTFFNRVHLLPGDLRFEHGGAKLASCPGRHLTSLRP